MQRSLTIMDRVEWLYNSWVNGTEFIDDLRYNFINEFRGALKERKCDTMELIDGIRVWYSSQKFPPDRGFIEFANDCAEVAGMPAMEFEDE